MRPLRICIYGGTDLQGTPIDFVSSLAFEILDSMPAVIVTGGFKHSNKQPLAVSADAAALNGARRFAALRGVDLKKCFEAWIPEPTLDTRPDVGGAFRMSEADGIVVEVMKGRTPLGRRLAMVACVDLVVTISGRRHTEVVVEQAVELGLPVLPIPDAGGDSKDLLDKHRDRIAAGFAPGALDECLNAVSQSIDTDPREAARATVALILTAKIGRCLVLMPFDEVHDELYAASIEPAIAKHMHPLRLDRLARSDAIYGTFGDAIRSATAVVVDVTQLNENVMYEIGFAHALGLKPLIYSREAARLEQLPLYLRTLNVRLASPRTSVAELIEEYVRTFMADGRAHLDRGSELQRRCS